MHKIEWHRAQGKGLKIALDEVSKSQKLSVDTVRKIYKKTKYRAKRRDPTGLEKLMVLRRARTGVAGNLPPRSGCPATTGRARGKGWKRLAAAPKIELSGLFIRCPP
jgi:hypothetical protein